MVKDIDNHDKGLSVRDLKGKEREEVLKIKPDQSWRKPDENH